MACPLDWPRGWRIHAREGCQDCLIRVRFYDRERQRKSRANRAKKVGKS